MEGDAIMKVRRFALMLVVGISLVGAAACMTTSISPADQAEVAISSGNLPPGYRDWTLISIARLGGKVNDLRAKLGNDVAIKAYRQGTLPFPDGAIITRLAWKAVPSEENNDALRPFLEQQLGKAETGRLLVDSFVAGPATNIQFMVKDSKKWASTGGWKFIEFDNGKPAPQAEGGEKSCYECHEPAADTDYVFTRYAQ
jgi:cytochrome P460